MIAGKFPKDFNKPEPDPLGNFLDNLKDNEGAEVATKGEDLMIKPILLADLEILNNWKGVYHIVCSGMREKGIDFLHEVEHSLFNPETDANDNYIFHFFKWKDMPWAIASVPQDTLAPIEAVATKYQFGLKRTVPVVMKGFISVQASLNFEKKDLPEFDMFDWFPIHNNVLTVESL